MSRRSVRSFTGAPVGFDELKPLLEAAMNAPSAGDGRPWQFVVVTDRAVLDGFAKTVDGDNPLFREAQAAIVLVADKAREGFPGFYPQDCACAAQNIYLTAHAKGLGTVWIALWGVPPRTNAVREALNVPQDMEPFAMFPIGVPAVLPEPEYRYNTDWVHMGKW